MGFQQAVRSGFANYFNFSGRAGQMEFWYFVLFGMAGSIVCTILDAIFFNTDLSPLSTLFGLAILLPDLAVSVRRLHDVDRSGWWTLLIFVPLVGIIVLVVWTIKKGPAAPNRFGPPTAESLKAAAPT